MIQPDQHSTEMTSRPSNEPVVGNYFVSTYPPFSVWNESVVDTAQQVLQQSQTRSNLEPWGLYVHIPFCSQRCNFCYYRSYASVSRQKMANYVTHLLQEFEILNRVPALHGRPPSFVYFGGGTPSLLPTADLERLIDGIQSCFPWQQAKEVTFECAPKTATPEKLELLRRAGVNRLSMGIQQMNDRVLKLNGRIHTVQDVSRAMTAIANQSFPTVNLDLIVGLLGETDQTFFESLKNLMLLEPDSVTIYQLEIPPNTPLFEAHAKGTLSHPLPTWEEKRRRLASAFDQLEQAGFTIRSAYAAVRDPQKNQFVYQEAQYRGADLIGVGIASFSYWQGIHYQNQVSMKRYQHDLQAKKLPIWRGYPLTQQERIVRQLILQLKLGSVSKHRFFREFGIDVVKTFAEVFLSLENRGMLNITENEVVLTREGRLCVDRLLSEFFLPEHQNINYW